RPYPVTVRPGSIPKTNMCSVSLGGEGDGFGHCGASGAGHDPFHHLVIDVVVRVHGLNVVEVVEVVDEAEELLGVGLLHRHGGGGQLGDCGAFDGDPGRLDRLAHLGQFARGRDHLEHAVATVAYIFGSGLEGGQHHGLLVPGRDDEPLLVEQVADRARLAQVAAAAGEGGADVAGGAVAVGGEDLDIKRHSRSEE